MADSFAKGDLSHTVPMAATQGILSRNSMSCPYILFPLSVFEMYIQKKINSHKESKQIRQLVGLCRNSLPQWTGRELGAWGMCMGLRCQASASFTDEEREVR